MEAHGISDWYYMRGDAEVGPVSRAALHGLAASGAIGDATPVRLDNGGPWMAYAETAPRPPAFALDPQPERLACSRCGGGFAPEALLTFRGETYCAACKRDFFLHLAQGTLDETPPPPHAFIRRALAKIVDAQILLLLALGISGALENLAPSWSEDWRYGTVVAITLVAYLGAAAWLTARSGGTPGKLLFRLRVTDRGGLPVGHVRALARAVAELASLAPLGLGYLVTGPGGERRPLHDRIALTRVAQVEGGWPWSR